MLEAEREVGGGGAASQAPMHCLNSERDRNRKGYSNFYKTKHKSHLNKKRRSQINSLKLSTSSDDMYAEVSDLYLQ